MRSAAASSRPQEVLVQVGDELGPAFGAFHGSYGLQGYSDVLQRVLGFLEVLRETVVLGVHVVVLRHAVVRPRHPVAVDGLVENVLLQEGLELRLVAGGGVVNFVAHAVHNVLDEVGVYLSSEGRREQHFRGPELHLDLLVNELQRCLRVGLLENIGHSKSALPHREILTHAVQRFAHQASVAGAAYDVLLELVAVVEDVHCNVELNGVGLLQNQVHHGSGAVGGLLAAILLRQLVDLFLEVQAFAEAVQRLSALRLLDAAEHFRQCCFKHPTKRSGSSASRQSCCV
ncbi:ABC transporter ATP-binding protein, putative [Babesia ovata]|uniref:ABC transporter ATP-binding protein, putative n=1 Tax=Babesia ovata TaxID=189622 RepID=A0A2H6KBH8_9APIC|nr:ABC transporter ATP-binding protein, putative [Babesia ovata]GBE60350.1 ABC transporter ATP-binding protein, putative [Babesia ovata]